jgi:hypothetical protein
MLWAGVLQHLDLWGCSFSSSYSAVEDFNPREPDGTYSINMARPSEWHLALALLRAAETFGGLGCWLNPTLSGKAFKLNGVRPLPKLQMEVSWLRAAALTIRGRTTYRRV